MARANCVFLLAWSLFCGRASSGHVPRNSDARGVDEVGDAAAKHYVKTKICPYWQNAGCVLDVLERLCSPGANATALLDMNAPENVWMCCCTRPYKLCSAKDFTSHKGQTCIGTLVSELGNFVPPKPPPQTEKLVSVLQDIRVVLLSASSTCTNFAKRNPRIRCSVGTENGQRPWQPPRADLSCELRAWQLHMTSSSQVFRKVEHSFDDCPGMPKSLNTTGKHSTQGANNDNVLGRDAKSSLQASLAKWTRMVLAGERALSYFLGALVILCSVVQLSLICRSGRRCKPKDFTPRSSKSIDGSPSTCSTEQPPSALKGLA